MLRITDHYDLNGLRPQPLDMPLELRTACPCCEAELAPVGAIYSTLTVRLGLCGRCGYLGYMDRPTSDWLESFYSSTWDELGQVGEVVLSEAIHPATAFVKRFVRKGSSVCDVGCGYGNALKQLRDDYRVSGVEKCKHRRVYASEFGHVSEYMHGKHDCILSHHVLEHMTEPAQLFKDAAAHQEKGIVYISVPYSRGENSLGIMLFLPHLHSFSMTALSILAARHGYGVGYVHATRCNLEMAFVKGEKVTIPDECVDLVTKLRRGLHANGLGPLFIWDAGDDRSMFGSEGLFAMAQPRMKYGRALVAQRRRGPGQYPVEVETPFLLVK